MIHYTGRGSKTDGRHTQKEFLKIMHNEFPEMIALKLKGVPLDPQKIKKNDLARWMVFSGATKIK
jgi:hypothetical protein